MRSACPVRCRFRPQEQLQGRVPPKLMARSSKTASVLLWTRPSVARPGTLPGRAGEDAGSDGRQYAVTAVASSGALAGVQGVLSIGRAEHVEAVELEDWVAT